MIRSLCRSSYTTVYIRGITGRLSAILIKPYIVMVLLTPTCSNKQVPHSDIPHIVLRCGSYASKDIVLIFLTPTCSNRQVPHTTSPHIVLRCGSYTSKDDGEWKQVLSHVQLPPLIFLYKVHVLFTATIPTSRIFNVVPLNIASKRHLLLISQNSFIRRDFGK